MYAYGCERLTQVGSRAGSAGKAPPQGIPELSIGLMYTAGAF